MKKTLLIASTLLVAFQALAQTPDGSIRTFRHPAAEIEALAMAAPVQSTSFNRMYSKAVIATQNCRSFPIAELAPNEARIGGLRINTMNFGLNRETVYDSIELLDVASGKTVPVKVPAGAKMKAITWAPGGNAFAFTNTTEKSIDLYLVDVTVAEPVAKKVNTLRLNATLGTPFMFLSDSEILYKSVPAANVQAPKQTVPFSNIIQDYTGSRKSGIRTYEDLIASPFDEDLYDYLTTSVLAIYSESGTRTFGDPAIYRSIEPSPDGRYLMTVTEHHPYSYIETHRSFPSKQFIMDLDGKMVKMIEDGTVKRDETPAARGENRAPKPTGFQWRPDLPATLVWTETKTAGGAMGGPGAGAPRPDGPRPDAAPKADDEKKEKKPEATYTTKMYQTGAPFNYETDKTIVLSAKFRPGRVTWGDEGFAVYTETSTDKKERYTMTFVPCDTLAKKNVLFTESTEKDSLGTFPVYGSLYTVRNQYNKSVVWTDAKKTTVYLSGSGRKDAEGYTYRFLDKVTIKDGKIANIWNENNNGQKETLVTISDTNKKGKIIVTRESWNVVPDYHEIDLKNGKSRQITHLVNSVSQMDQLITKQTVTYTRKDGLKCFGTLYLPASYDKERDGKLPVLMWTYPYEYQSFRESEEQRPDRYKFTKPSYGSAMIWATQGYAVLDDFTMSIVSEHPDSLPNNRFIEQLVMSAEAAVDFMADSLGVGDRDRMAIGGHSYGGFMTANLLSHTRLFKAGIARSGAYMRSLTPFGFQSERRNFWKAKDVYDEMSPFNYADKVKDALLIIHGQLDDNMGTFPVQSERLYQALVYFGATARYVQLPLEAHSYYGKETTLDMLYETGAWLDKYVKNWEPKKEPEKGAGKAPEKAE